MGNSWGGDKVYRGYSVEFAVANVEAQEDAEERSRLMEQLLNVFNKRGESAVYSQLRDAGYSKSDAGTLTQDVVNAWLDGLAVSDPAGMDAECMPFEEWRQVWGEVAA